MTDPNGGGNKDQAEGSHASTTVLPTTPHRRPTLRPPTSTSRRTPLAMPPPTSIRRTPAPPSTAAHPTSRPPPKSPHVIRAWETKRALTPGRERRKSARWHLHATRERDSPMDILKKLSLNLAPKSRPFYLDATPKPTPKQTPRASLVQTPGSARRESVVFNYHSDPEGLDDEEEDDDDERTPPPPPRLSLDPDARLDRENDEFTRKPLPRLSSTPGGSGGRRSTGIGSGPGDISLTESTFSVADTSISIELPRRAEPESYRNRMSFGIRLSDRFYDLDELGAGGGDESMLTDAGAGIEYSIMSEVGEAGNESTENIWEGLDMGENTRDLNRGFSLEEEFGEGYGFGGGLDEDSLGAFQLTVPELVEDEEGEGSENEGVGDTMDLDVGDVGHDADGEDSEEQVDEDDKEDEDETEHSARLGSPPTLQDNSNSPTLKDPSYPLSPLSSPNTHPPQSTSAPIIPSRKKDSKDSKASRAPKPPKPLKLSKHNLPVPSLPPRLIKSLATTLSGGKKLPSETVDQIIKASEVFFENACVRIGEFAEHAGRRTVGGGDVELLMKRQRILNGQNTVFSLAEKYLPRELLQEIRMPPVVPGAAGGAGVKRKRAPVAAAGGGSRSKSKGKGKATTLEGEAEE